METTAPMKVLAFISFFAILVNFGMPSLNPVIRIVVSLIALICGIALIVLVLIELNKRHRR